MAHTILLIAKVGSLQDQSSFCHTEAFEPVSGDGLAAQQLVALGIVETSLVADQLGCFLGVGESAIGVGKADSKVICFTPIT
jgi:hypothetical protein